MLGLRPTWRQCPGIRGFGDLFKNIPGKGGVMGVAAAMARWASRAALQAAISTLPDRPVPHPDPGMPR
jgi:hypothetical protein